MTQKYVLSLFEYTGNMVKPWVENGYKALIVDIQHVAGLHYHSKNDAIYTLGVDILGSNYSIGTLAQGIFGNDPSMIFAFPPCTHLASSGARWWNEKGWEALTEALELVRRAIRMTFVFNSPWMLENPVGRLTKHWRKPNFTFQPYEYGGYLTPPSDFYTKRTCIWCGNGFVKPTPKPVLPFEGSKMHKLPPSAERANIRSATPMGFAYAVYEANHADK